MNGLEVELWTKLADAKVSNPANTIRGASRGVQIAE
jgi:hypothetical protein